MKLCAIQIPFARNAADAEKSAAMAVAELNNCDRSCDIILTPEYTNAPAAFAKGECIPFAQRHTAELLAAARAAAVRCDAIVAVNYVCEAEPGFFRNTTEIFDRAGTSRGRYFKQHLPRAEKNVNLLDEEYTKKFRVPEIVEIDGIRFGFLICYDTYFDEYIAHLARRHPDVVLVSSFQRAERPEILRMQNQHLAFTCNCFVLRASVSMGENAVAGGNSLAAAPEGVILGEFGNRCGTFSCEVPDVKRKYMRSNSFGGELIPNDRFIEQARAPWACRPCGSMTIASEVAYPYPRVCAHRGFKTVAPENTMAAFGAAVALGAPEIEMDIRFTADGVPVIGHDSDLSRVSDGTGTIEEHTLAELRRMDFGGRFNSRFAGVTIPTFEEVLSKFARHAIINLHLKSEEKEGEEELPKSRLDQVVGLLDAYDQLEHVYFMGAPSVMSAAIKYAPHIPRCMGAFPDPWHIVDRAVAMQCAKVQFFVPYVNPEMIAQAKAHGIKCNLYFCDDPAQVPQWLAAGIDTILTNDYWPVAQAVREATREKNAPSPCK